MKEKEGAKRVVRRPLLWMLASFILGSLFYQVPFVITVIMGVLGLGVAFLFLIRYSKNRHDICLLCVPVFFFLGNLLMQNQQQPGPLDSYLAGKKDVSVTVTGSVSSIQSSSTSYKILLEQVHYDKTQLTSKYILVYAKDVSGLSIGNRVKVSGKVSAFDAPTNAYQFDMAAYYKIQMIDYRMYATSLSRTGDSVSYLADALYRMRRSFLAVFQREEDERAAESLSAMLLGEKALLDEDTKSLYQAGGIAHVISISGLHVALLGMSVYTFIKRLLGLKAGVICSTSFIFCYGILTNFSVSTNRAVIMLMLFLVAKVAGRTYDLLSAVALSGLLILFKEPMEVYQCGFLLSYGAIFGIAVVYPCLLMPVDEERLRQGVNWEEKEYSGISKAARKGLLFLRYYIVKTLLLQTAIMAVTLPILLWFYYRVAVYSFLLNLLVIPLMTYVVLFGVLGAVAGCIHMAAGHVLLYPAVMIIRLYLFLCEMVTHLPCCYLVLGQPSPWKVAVYYTLLVISCILMHGRRRIGLFVLGAGAVLFFVHIPQKELSITSVDVGQGDCYVIQAPKSGVYIIDGGSTSEDQVGRYRILPYLYGSGIDSVDEVFVSHADKDHISGIEELLEAVKKGELRMKRLILAKTSFQDKNYDSLVKEAKECGVRVCYMECGGYIKAGEICFTCLHPLYSYLPEKANDYSLVLSLSYREFSMLFMGDLSSEAEEELFRNNELSQYDVLKVAHHGSKYSSSEKLLEVLSPKIALVSCGEDNSYGHPHKELLQRLEEQRISTFITMESGMIRVATDGRKIAVKEYK